jgi:nucleotide-binding universal stress UspA family protein
MVMCDEESGFRVDRILAAVNFNDLSSLALKYAAVGAFQFNAELIVMHAERVEVPPYVLADDYERLLGELRKMRQSAEEFLADYVYQILGGATEQLRIRYLIVEEHPVDAILKASETEKVELVVMGTYPEVTNQCSVDPVVLRGHAAIQITAFAREGNFDLLVLGAERKPFLHALLFGTTTEAVLRSSPHPHPHCPSTNK